MDKQTIASLKKEEKKARKKANDTESTIIAIKIIDIYSEVIIQERNSELIKELYETIKEFCNKKEQTLYFLIKVYQSLIERIFDFIDNNDLMQFYSLLHSILISNLQISNDFVYIVKLIEANDFIMLKESLLNIQDINQYKGLTILRKLLKKLSICSDAELKPNEVNHTIQSNQYNNTQNESTNNISLTPKDLTSTNRKIVLSRNNIKENTYIPNKNLPFITINFTALLSLTQIIDTINNGFLNASYLNIYTNITDNVMVFQFKEKNCCKACWLSMMSKLGFLSEINRIHQIRIRLASNNVSNKTKYEHFLEFRCISGNKTLLENAMLLVIKHLCLHIRSLAICKKSKQWNCNIEDAIGSYLLKKSPQCKFNKDYTKLIEEEGSIIEMTNAEASSYYEIYRLLSQENYDVGKNIAKFITDFKEENKDLAQACQKIPYQMKTIISIIDECISTFNNYFNYSRDKKLAYVNPAVDKYIFNKLYFILYSIYSEKYKKDNEKFLIAQKKLKENKSIDSIMAYLEIKPKYRGKEEYPGYVPYKPSIDSINKIEYEQSPMEKLETLIKASLELRNTILSLTKGKGELESMDDELPLFIYITTQVSIPNLPAELHMIEDYITYTRAIINKETKVLTNLFSSMFYITNNNWNE